MVPPEDGSCPKKENGPHALPMKTFFSLPPLSFSLSHAPLFFLTFIHIIVVYFTSLDKT